jgi:Tfp pilus assembly protein PilX
MMQGPAGLRQAGVALVTALVLMLVTAMMGVAAARAAIHAGKSARYERDRQVAFAAAEAALADAERDIEGAAATAPGRAALFDAGPSGLTKGCGRGVDDLGLCRDEGGTPQWQAADLQADASTAGYGSFTGALMATGGGSLPARAPRYVIEFLPITGAPPGSGRFFRITSIGFGARQGTQVVLQSFYRKPVSASGNNGSGNGSGTGSGSGGAEGPGNGGASGGHGQPPVPPTPASAIPAGRLAWREVANWPDLHRAAIK